MSSCHSKFQVILSIQFDSKVCISIYLYLTTDDTTTIYAFPHKKHLMYLTKDKDEMNQHRKGITTFDFQ